MRRRSPRDFESLAHADRKSILALVIIETLPEVLALPTDQKEILAEELLNQVVLEKDKDPALSELLRRRLTEYEADPNGGIRWQELRDRLLKRRDA